MSSHLDKHYLIYKNQYGFRINLATTTLLAKFPHELVEMIIDWGKTDVIFLEFAKAFNEVSHPNPLAKLDSTINK